MIAAAMARAIIPDAGMASPRSAYLMGGVPILSHFSKPQESTARE
jgi:hypothetical protein